MIKLGTSEYRTLHYWVERMLGKPMICSNCGITNAKRYHWSNISRLYKKDLFDWERLCPSCHGRKDLRKGDLSYKTHCKRGHAITPQNIKLRKNKYRECKECVSMANTIWQRKNYKIKKALKET